MATRNSANRPATREIYHLCCWYTVPEWWMREAGVYTSNGREQLTPVLRNVSAGFAAADAFLEKWRK